MILRHRESPQSLRRADRELFVADHLNATLGEMARLTEMRLQDLARNVLEHTLELRVEPTPDIQLT